MPICSTAVGGTGGKSVAATVKFRGFGMVRDKFGIPIVDDYDLLPIELKQIIDMEVERGDYTHDSYKNRPR